jgi:lipopolysaccharide assembly outer membrane protein LptD (OstA)
MYWVLLGIELAWETSNAVLSGKSKSQSTTSLYKLYPWRHTILFDVIPIIQTLIPFVIYFMASDKNAINGPINVRIRQNNTPRPVQQRPRIV